MIFLKKKKLKGDAEKYFEYKKKYGPPLISAFGRAVWEQTGEQFVKDAKTGNIILHTQEVKYLGKSENGAHFYLGPRSKLLLGDTAIPSFFK